MSLFGPFFVLIIVFAQLIGAIVYLAVGRPAHDARPAPDRMPPPPPGTTSG